VPENIQTSTEVYQRFAKFTRYLFDDCSTAARKCLVLKAFALFPQERPAYITSLDLDVAIEPICRARILREGVLGSYCSCTAWLRRSRKIGEAASWLREYASLSSDQLRVNGMANRVKTGLSRAVWPAAAAPRATGNSV
jgi:hypothetical protein